MRDLLPYEWQIGCGQGGVVGQLVLDGQSAAVIELKIDEDDLTARLVVGNGPASNSVRFRRLVQALIHAAEIAGRERLTFETSDVLARHEARALGFKGGLREKLTLLTHDDATRGVGEIGQHESALVQLRALLLDCSVQVARSKGTLTRLIQHAQSGTGAQLRFTLTSPAGRLRIFVPERDDLMIEPVAMVAATAMAIKSRFGDAVSQVRTVSFDFAQHGMSKSRVAGAANLAVPAIHINAGYCCYELAERVEARKGSWEPRRPSASTSAVFRVDKVTAHEFGHHLDAAFQGSRYHDSIEFRRTLGESLGVPTIEMAVRGWARGLEMQAAEARRLLAEQISPYATTNIAEAMAELFAVWWFGGPGSPPLIQVYDQLIEKYFPSRP